jgi:hypothetical protein
VTGGVVTGTSLPPQVFRYQGSVPE